MKCDARRRYASYPLSHAKTSARPLPELGAKSSRFHRPEEWSSRLDQCLKRVMSAVSAAKPPLPLYPEQQTL